MSDLHPLNLAENHLVVAAAIEPPEEPGAANALCVNGTVVLPSAFPATAERLRAGGFEVRTVDVTELLKAESGVTCSSLLFWATALRIR